MKLTVAILLCLTLAGCSTAYKTPKIEDEYLRRQILDCIHDNYKCRGGLWM